MLLIDRNLIALSNKSQSSTITPEEKDLLDSSLDIIRARTLSILRSFANDAERKTCVIKFLIETGIVGKLKLDLSGANFSGAKLEWADLSGAKLKSADLSGANLQCAFLQDAHLEGAKLQKANLKSADLEGAILELANLEGAILELANLEDIECDSETTLPDKSAFNGAKNIPEELKKRLDIP